MTGSQTTALKALEGAKPYPPNFRARKIAANGLPLYVRNGRTTARIAKLFFAVDIAMPSECLPADAGLIVADAFGGAIIRDAPLHRLARATRRSLLLRFARIGADRLHLLNDPKAAAPS